MNAVRVQRRGGRGRRALAVVLLMVLLVFMAG